MYQTIEHNRKQIVKRFPDAMHLLTEFPREEYTLVIAGYPVWKGYIISAESEFWIEVNPHIDIKKQLIYLPKISKKKETTYTAVETTSDLSTQINEILLNNKMRFFDTIPADIYEAVSRYNNSHWEIIKAITAIGEPLIKLIKQNPVLAYFVINIEKLNVHFLSYRHIDILPYLLGAKQRKILELCGFPPTARMVKIFSKMDPAFISLDTLIKFRKMFADNYEIKEKILHLLSFRKEINQSFFEFIAENYKIVPLLSYKIIDELLESSEYSILISRLNKLMKQLKKWNISNLEITSLKKLDAVEKEVENLIVLQIEKEKKEPFAPLSDNEHIKLISTKEELQEWGRRQYNCLATRHRELTSKLSYFYKINYYGEEASFQIRKTRDGLKKASLLGFRNQQVSAKLKIMVSDWLRQYPEKNITPYL